MATMHDPCLYCLSAAGPFTSIEHILPEGLGNTTLVLPRGVVCDPCNNGPLAHVDSTFLGFLPVALMRVVNAIPRKGGGTPTARLANARLDRPTATDLVIRAVGKRGVIRPQPGGFKVDLTGRRMTARYTADVTRFLHKAALGFMYLDHGQLILDHRYDPVREIVRGQPYHGYLVLATKGEPRKSVSFTYQFATIDGNETVMTEIDVFGVRMSTDLLYRRLPDDRPHVEGLAVAEF